MIFLRVIIRALEEIFFCCYYLHNKCEDSHDAIKINKIGESPR
jgi:hypothetical protein